MCDTAILTMASLASPCNGDGMSKKIRQIKCDAGKATPLKIQPLDPGISHNQLYTRRHGMVGLTNHFADFTAAALSAILFVLGPLAANSRAGFVYSWGHNDFGQLGDGTTVDRSTPVAVSELAGGVSAISGRFFHTLCVDDGALYAWGSGYLGN